MDLYDYMGDSQQFFCVCVCVWLGQGGEGEVGARGS